MPGTHTGACCPCSSACGGRPAIRIPGHRGWTGPRAQHHRGPTHLDPVLTRKSGAREGSGGSAAVLSRQDGVCQGVLPSPWAPDRPCRPPARFDVLCMPVHPDMRRFIQTPMLRADRARRVRSPAQTRHERLRILDKRGLRPAATRPGARGRQTASAAGTALDGCAPAIGGARLAEAGLQTRCGLTAAAHRADSCQTSAPSRPGSIRSRRRVCGLPGTAGSRPPVPGCR
jgi:hypothetical protein